MGDSYYNIHDIIRIKISNHKFNLVPVYFIVKDEIDYDIEIRYEPFSFKPKMNIDNKIPVGLRIYYDDKIFIHRMYHINSGYFIIKEEEKKYTIIFNYIYKIFRKPTMNIYAIMEMKLLNKGFSFIHAGGVSRNGKGLIFPAFSDTGKTITTLRFMREGYKVLSDDTLITDGEKVYSYLVPTHVVIANPFKNIPILKKFRITKKLNPDIAKKTDLKYIFFLKKGKENRIEEADKGEMLRDILISTEISIPLFPNPAGVFMIYYYVKGLNLDDYYNKRKKILRRLVEKADTYFVTATNSKEFYKLISQKTIG